MRVLLILILIISPVLGAAAAGATTDYPTYVGGEPVPTGGIPNDRNTPAMVDAYPARSGTFLHPVIGDQHRYTDTFGACRGSGCSRPHLGVDMLAPKGVPVVAVDGGTVSWLSDCCALAIRHDDGWTTWYIHLNNDSPGTDDGLAWGIAPGIERGSRVEAGWLIGWIGDSGNAESSPSHLHFELQDPDGVWHNPFPYVEAASRLSAPLADGAGARILPDDAGVGTALTGDFDGDGRVDVGNFLEYDGRWVVGTSDGSRFDASTWADFSTTNWDAQVVGDFDGDGRDDLANYAATNGTWWVSASNGSAFTTRRWYDGPALSFEQTLVGDFDGDGRDDVAAFDTNDGTWRSFSSGGRASFEVEVLADYSTTRWARQLVGDFDGDGRDDLANFSDVNGTWWVTWGGRGGTSLWADYSTTRWARQLVGDFDGDGRDDLFNYATSNGTWWVSTAAGDASSTRLVADYSTTNWDAQWLGDVDGDGDDDILNYASANGTWWVTVDGRTRLWGSLFR